MHGRDPLVTTALAAGLAKEEIHQLTGISRSTIDRILAKIDAASATGGFVARHGLVKYRPTLGRQYPRHGVCEICGRPPVGKPHLLFEHCHAHGWVRGLVCNWCNDNLGFLENGQTSRAAYRADLLPKLTEYRRNCPDCPAV